MVECVVTPGVVVLVVDNVDVVLEVVVCVLEVVDAVELVLDIELLVVLIVELVLDVVLMVDEEDVVVLCVELVVEAVELVLELEVVVECVVAPGSVLVVLIVELDDVVVVEEVVVPPTTISCRNTFSPSLHTTSPLATVAPLLIIFLSSPSLHIGLFTAINLSPLLDRQRCHQRLYSVCIGK